MSVHTFGDNTILSFNIDFLKQIPIIKLELFNPRERKEIILEYELKDINMEKIEEPLMLTKQDFPIMKFRGPEMRNVNICAVFKNANIKNL